jgi:hypothetical protein
MSGFGLLQEARESKPNGFWFCQATDGLFVG